MDVNTTNTSFDFWTPEENDLVQARKKFALAINFSDAQAVESSLYEWDPMLKDILELSSEIIHDGAGYALHNLIMVDVEKQFIVIRRNRNYTVKYIGQYATNTEAINTIKTDQLTLISKDTDDEDEDDDFEYVVVNLENTTPYFFGQGKLVKRNHTRAGLFYTGTSSKPIEF